MFGNISTTHTKPDLTKLSSSDSKRNMNRSIQRSEMAFRTESELNDEQGSQDLIPGQCIRQVQYQLRRHTTGLERYKEEMETDENGELWPAEATENQLQKLLLLHNTNRCSGAHP